LENLANEFIASHKTYTPKRNASSQQAFGTMAGEVVN